MSSAPIGKTPPWTAVVPLAALALFGWTSAKLAGSDGGFALILAAAFLGASVFAAVHHAEILALRLGEPFGSILLAVAVTVIEVGLIVSFLLSGAEGVETVARDTIFSAVMIAVNGVMGISLVVGARRHGELGFQLNGATAALAVLGTLAVLSLVMPQFTISAPGATYSSTQLLYVALASLVLYVTFIRIQTVKHRDYFLFGPEEDEAAITPSRRQAAVSLALLLLCLVAVVLLAKQLSYPLDNAIARAGLPQAFVGVVVAMIVLLPESIAAIKAAIRNKLQVSLNLALGSAIASIGLTIPAVAIVSLVVAQPLDLGLPPAQTALLGLTLLIGALTLGTGRTTVLQGVIHLVICGFFLLVSAVP
ncbi:calcium:proton antiporter [Sphingopyxis sp.]|uniref:calcium:proton antiporter n=1 Tax=Sphingopyxis sp. TaxID=1908224 RepID=UPI003D6D1B32